MRLLPPLKAALLAAPLLLTIAHAAQAVTHKLSVTGTVNYVSKDAMNLSGGMDVLLEAYFDGSQPLRQPGNDSRDVERLIITGGTESLLIDDHVSLDFFSPKPTNSRDSEIILYHSTLAHEVMLLLFADASSARDPYVLPDTGTLDVSFDKRMASLDVGFNVGQGYWSARINSASISALPLAATAAAVPLPASAWLLLAGLGGLGFARRRGTRDH